MDATGSGFSIHHRRFIRARYSPLRVGHARILLYSPPHGADTAHPGEDCDNRRHHLKYRRNVQCGAELVLNCAPLARFHSILCSAASVPCCMTASVPCCMSLNEIPTNGIVATHANDRRGPHVGALCAVSRYYLVQMAGTVPPNAGSNHQPRVRNRAPAQRSTCEPSRTEPPASRRAWTGPHTQKRPSIHLWRSGRGSGSWQRTGSWRMSGS